MKIELKVVGKTAFDYLKTGVAIYEKRLKRYGDFSITIIPDIKNAKSLSEAQIKEKEGVAILKKIDKSPFVILLDDKGKMFTSKEFSSYLENKLMPSGKNIIFIIGGAYGFSDAVYARANAKLSLSKMTFSHQMVRLFFVEQLYRAYSIIGNEPYHHE
ncbi:MAG: 23S rRNA (pseudouridine1915-N3)-methyltransferase [Maribacter sp.]|jgi:23S rRNA (pseudouridine1915-N3)-methyltransferase